MKKEKTMKIKSVILGLALLTPFTAFGYGSYYSAPGYNAANTATQMMAQNQRSNRPSGVNPAFVEKVLNERNMSYAEALSRIPAGFIGAIGNEDGNIYMIEPGTFDTNRFTYL